MSAAITLGVVGTVGSIYSGMKAGDAAEDMLSGMNAAAARSQAFLGENKKIADELKTRQLALVDQPLARRIADVQGTGLTASGQMNLNRFNLDMSNIDRAIQEGAPLAGEGVTGSRELTQQFQKAKGLATITLQDKAAKEAELRGLMSMATPVPGWAQVATRANESLAGGASSDAARYEGQAQQLYGQEASAYGSAAQGLGNLAKMYASGTPKTVVVRSTIVLRIRVLPKVLR